ncbi:MAG TPA: FAD-dependent oxidoreductase, partial [Clostridia bacterium]|nr:FAD-dependent oxidoreductase [Clostridia bacterium]
MAYKRLFEKGKIGSLELKNRAVMSPMATNFANHDGTASMQLIRYYAERAKGGVGLIITEYIGVDHVYSMPAPNMLGLSQDYQVKSHEALTEAVHAYGAKIFAQLHHAGSASKSAYSGNRAISASEVPLFTGAPAPSAMTLEQIRQTQEKFLEAALRAQKAGYDGIELHGAHSYLITQFLSPYYNRRSDEYGGSFENRIRFLSEIIDSIRAALGRGFPISVRISGDEMTKEIEGTLTLEDGLEIGRFLVQKGIDALNVSNGNAFNPNANCDPYSYTPGWKRHVAAAFKSALSIPVIATNTIKNPAFAEQLLEEGVSDFVALGRALLADAEFINKAQAGKEDEIRQCIGCMVCRERVLAKNIGAACAVNARTGREYILNEYILNGFSRPVAVIGGGPAGMEAARVLSLRGFDVTLFEKESELGGSLGVSAKPPHKELILELKNTMVHELALSGVNIRTYCEADHRVISDLKPEGVFLAIGA